MITIIHGDDIAASRNYLTTLRGSAIDPVTLSAESLNLTELTQILSGGGLFEEARFIAIERLLSNKKVSSPKEIIEVLLKYSGTHTIVIWENKEVTKLTLNKFPGATVRVFKLPQTLFQLMDSIKPKNTRQILTLYHSTKERIEEELILYMLVRQIRLLLAFKTGSNITELKQVSWQAQKLRTQANLFKLEELMQLYMGIYEIEKAMKTGESIYDTSSLIDFLLVKI